jgi:hypothetical protein
LYTDAYTPVVLLFITTDKALTRGKISKGCYERLKDKTGRSYSLAHTRWSGGRRYLRRVKWIKPKNGSGQGYDSNKRNVWKTCERCDEKQDERRPR